ncbi:DUF4254 domain-containing protein [candidate division KSB1 bacterium]|nr:DUF4254 domain-containing protein [candidate division KSB1 bacterium]
MKSLSEIFSPFQSENLIEWFDDLVTLWHEAGPIEPEDHHSPKGMFQWVHYNNFKLWHYEDQARRTDLEADKIVAAKRKIDYHNQQRNDGIEKIDVWIDNVLNAADIKPDETIEINSETPGSIVDRLSILTLKVYHMEEQTRRKDVEKTHVELCRFRCQVLAEQRFDLGKALDRLIRDLRQASKRHKIYRQFKMYNDPKFNPYLYNSN